MKKRKTRILLALVIATLTVFSSVFGVLAQAASTGAVSLVYKDFGDMYAYDAGYKNEVIDTAMKIKDIPISDDKMYFARGAAINKKYEDTLAFQVFTKDLEVVTHEDGEKNTKLGNVAAGVWFEYEYDITLLRKNADESYGTEVSSWKWTASTASDEVTITNVMEAKSNYTPELLPMVKVGNDESDADLKPDELVWEEAYDDNGKKTGEYFLRLYLQTPSAFDEYTAIFSYKKIKYERNITVKFNWNKLIPWKLMSEPLWLLPDQKIENTVVDEYCIKSDERSYAYVLDKALEAGEISYEISEDDSEAEKALKTRWSNIMNGEEQSVYVEYLENIGKTPFATKVKKQITLDIAEGQTELTPFEVASALNVAHVNCLISPCVKFVLDTESGYYVAEYAKSVHLASETSDGAVKNYFLDANLSYEDYYKQFVDDEIFTEDMYNYCFYQKIVSVYPELDKYKPSEVYGYFGFVVIPETKSLESIFSEMFNVPTEYDGIIKSFYFQHSITLEKYDKLLVEYDYSWLERAWNKILGTLTESNARHYIIYADCTTSEAYIKDQGGDKNLQTYGDVIINHVKRVFEDIGGAVASIDLAESGGFIILGIVAGAVVVIIVVKSSSKKRRSSGRTRKTKSRKRK